MLGVNGDPRSRPRVMKLHVCCFVNISEMRKKTRDRFFPAKDNFATPKWIFEILKLFTSFCDKIIALSFIKIIKHETKEV